MNIRGRKKLFEGLVVWLEEMEVEVASRGWYRFQVVRHPGGVAVLPLHPDGTVTLVRQPRPAIGGPLLEIPAGRLSPGEQPEACARRELLEETGLKGGGLQPLGVVHPAPGFSDEKLHLFLATGFAQGTSEPEEYEDIEPVRLPLEEAVRMALEGEITDSKTIIALLRARERLS